MAFNHADGDFARLEGMPVFRAWMSGTGHGGTYREPNGGPYGRVAAAWLKWQLLGDTEADRIFTGKPCGLCRDPAWHVPRKGIE